ncbi:MAG: threonylcarbamoyl-AMP synthase [Bacteroidia bacterium]|nr:threonylcarbamoyl-AMP synthase [Bacteroidia bacterium]
MLLTIHPESPQERLIQQVIDCLKNGGVIIYPTDTVYGLGCDIHNKKAIETICRIKGIKPEKALFSCICEDFKRIGDYTVHVHTPIFKLMKRVLPGPYTFILEASHNIPRHFQSKRKTVGIRVVDNAITNAIVKALGNPLLTTSLRADEDLESYMTDPQLIFERYEKLVDMVIDGGTGGTEGSTILDCSLGEDKIILVREGAGSLSDLGIEVSEA